MVEGAGVTGVADSVMEVGAGVAMPGIRFRYCGRFVIAVGVPEADTTLFM